MSFSKYENSQPFNFYLHYINLQNLHHAIVTFVVCQIKIAEFPKTSRHFDAILWDSKLVELEPPNNEPEPAAEPAMIPKQLRDKCQMS